MLSFAGVVPVSYSQLLVASGEMEGVEYLAAVHGQDNGLCGAAVPGFLFLVTGTHTGLVHLTVRELGAAPELTAAEEIVEVSFSPETPRVSILGWDGERLFQGELSVPSNRVRWSLMSAASAHVTEDGGPQIEHCLLEFWPAPTSGDAVVRTSTESARYWHSQATMH